MKIKIVFLAVGMILFSCDKSRDQEYDEKTNQKEVLTRQGIDSVLSQFDQIKYEELDDYYKTYTECEPGFSKSLQGKSFYTIKGEDIYKYIVGKYRIRHFLAYDDYYTNNSQDIDGGHKQYWLVDKKMLYMTLDLIHTLDQKGYNKYGFKVRESHRHPRLNRMRGGASKSQHIHGTAVDIIVEDINNDGKENQDDKSIVLEIMENIVSNKGGLGKYPGTMTVHFDCRGYRARWDSY